MTNILNKIKYFCHQKNIPLIPIQADSIYSISEPNLFYQTIIENINTANRRILLSALYLGVGSKERNIVEALQFQLQNHEKLRIQFLLDSRRGTRRDSSGQSSATMLESVINCNRASLHLVDTMGSSFIGKVLKRFQRWNEVISAYHAKILIFDDDVILTGANLSSLYFEQRQDRYIRVKGSKFLSNYLYDLFNVVRRQNESMITEINNLNAKTSALTANEYSDTFILPLVQFGRKNLRMEEEFLDYLSSVIPEGARVHLSSGYFNPSPVVNSLRIDSILTASEKTNNFSYGHGLSKHIPRIYSAIYRRFLSNRDSCHFSVYNRSQWTFHAKGLWIDGMQDMYVTFIGSSNYNYRSYWRDFEVQMVVLTRNKNLIRLFEDERAFLWSTSAMFDKSNDSLIHRLSALIFRGFL